MCKRKNLVIGKTDILLIEKNLIELFCFEMKQLKFVPKKLL